MGKVILQTKEYAKFKKLKGNRNVDAVRVQKIINSINNVGYVTSPIIVNENLEVIDGQGRLEALRILGLPVEYVVHEKIGIDECISMNIHQINWNDRDYIDSYADRNFKSYILLKKLLEKYKLNLMILSMAICKRSRFDSQMIRNGRLNITEQEYEEAIKRLDYAIKFIPFCKRKHGSITKLLQAVILCYDFEDVDNNRLFEKVKEFMPIMTPWSNLDECFVSVEEVYNRNIRKRIYIYTEYRKLVEDMNVGLKERLEKLRGIDDEEEGEKEND